MKNLKAIQKHWREEFEKKFPEEEYNHIGSFWFDIQDFLSIAIAGAVKEVLEGVRKMKRKFYCSQDDYNSFYWSDRDKAIIRLKEIGYKKALQDIEEKGKYENKNKI